MKIINLGSINIDHVYSVEHFVRPGETLRSDDYKIFSGGKGANQSIALAHAGAKVVHAGRIGKEGVWLKERLHQAGVNTCLIETVDEPTGHALIQVNAQGENAIIIHPGANESFNDSYIQKVFESSQEGDYILLQNEINALEKILEMSKKRGLTVIFNPAPMNPKVKKYPLEHVDIFIINKVEGEMLTSLKEPHEIVSKMQVLYPHCTTILTLGKDGVIYKDKQRCIRLPALEVKSVDTTGAGDTFIGYFLAELSQGKKTEECLQMGIKASSICVGREGAADSIPHRQELESLSL